MSAALLFTVEICLFTPSTLLMLRLIVLYLIQCRGQAVYSPLAFFSSLYINVLYYVDCKSFFEWTTAEEGQVDDMISACPS